VPAAAPASTSRRVGRLVIALFSPYRFLQIGRGTRAARD
jgi:hypothetical protein